MSDVVIRAEGLGKKYRIGHQVSKEGYTALRDVVARTAKGFARSALDMLRGRQLVAGDEIEEFWALRDVNFEVKGGDVVGIIGRNGAGKSTLLKILSRIVEPSSGRVEIRGRVASLLEVGTGFHPELSGRENIFLNGAILGMSHAEIKRKFEAIVAFAELETFLDTPVKRYSSGMYVRLAFAVAAHLEPEIIVIDEVLAVGDAEFQKKCLGKVAEVAGHGRTVLFVSHNLGAIKQLCSRALLLVRGEATFDGSIDRAIENYMGINDSLFPEMKWLRSFDENANSISFVEITGSLTGSQPNLIFHGIITIYCNRNVSPSFIALDFCDAAGIPLMQAIPALRPFLRGEPGRHVVEVSVSLPPLIPGAYSVDFWVGPHNTVTFDFVRRAIVFEIVDMPQAGRTFPYTKDHGYIVPPSRCVYSKRDIPHLSL
jgi:lipopolysaccharide transport system ATP-binding protein